MNVTFGFTLRHGLEQPLPPPPWAVRRYFENRAQPNLGRGFIEDEERINERLWLDIPSPGSPLPQVRSARTRAKHRPPYHWALPSGVTRETPGTAPLRAMRRRLPTIEKSVVEVLFRQMPAEGPIRAGCGWPRDVSLPRSPRDRRFVQLLYLIQC